MGIFNLKKSNKVAEELPVNSQKEVIVRDNTRIVEKLNKDYSFRTKQTIKKWRDALNLAESEYTPNRTPLLDVYDEIILDNVLKSVMEQRNERILQTPFNFVDKKGNVLDELNKELKNDLMYKLLWNIADTYYYGHTLLEMSYNADGISQFTLVPRENVIPECQGIKFNKEGFTPDIYYTDNKDVIEIFWDRSDLGLLMQLAPTVLWKKQALISWSMFTEKFGQPLVWGKTPSINPSDRDKLFSALQNLSSNSTIVSSPEDNVEFIQPSSTDAYKVYLELINYCNSEISRAILGQTMTTEDGSSRSQAEVHQNELNYRTKSDLRQIQNLMNDYIIPILQEKGNIKQKDVYFEFDMNIDLALDEELKIDELMMREYELDQEYLETKYNVKIKNKKNNEPSGINKVLE